MSVNVLHNGQLTRAAGNSSSDGWNTLANKPFESLGTEFNVPTSGTDKDKLKLADSLTQKLEKIDINENLSDALGAKADSATTLAGYGITDAYTKTEVDTALAGKANTSQLDEWTAEKTVASNKTVTFTGLNDAYSYKLFCDAPMTSVTNIAKTGSGTAVQLVYTLDGTNLLVGTSKCKLRVIH